MKPCQRRAGKALRGRGGKTTCGKVGKAARGRRGGKASVLRSRSRPGSVGKLSSVASKKVEGGVETNDVNDHECGLCKQPYTDPRLLNCMHTFCNGCILQILHNNDRRDVVCPTCCFATKADVGGTLQLCRNHVIQQKVKWKRVSVMRQNFEIICSDCETEPAINLCSDCQWKLCDFCTTHHKRSARFKDHSIQNIEGVCNEELFEKEPILCSEHHLEIKYFCQNCKTMICGNCAQCPPHQGHVFQPMGEVMESRLASLRKSLDESDEVCKQYEDYLSNMEIFHGKSVEEAVVSKKRIEAAFAGISSYIQEEKLKLLDWLDEKCDSSERALKLAKERAQHVKGMSQYLKDVSLFPKEEMFDVIQDGVGKWEEAVECMKTAAGMKPPTPADTVPLKFSHLNSVPKPVSSEVRNEFYVDIHARQIKVDNSFANNLKYIVRRMCQVVKEPGVCGGLTFHEAIYSGHFKEISVKVENVTKERISRRIPVEVKNILFYFGFVPPRDSATDAVGILFGPQENPNTHITVTLKNHLGPDLIHIFTSRYNSYFIFQNFISWDNLIDPVKGYIMNDSVTFHVRMQVLSA